MTLVLAIATRVDWPPWSTWPSPYFQPSPSSLMDQRLTRLLQNQSRFSELMRIALHAPYQIKLGERFPAMFKFPPLDAAIGIPHLKTAQESKFLNNYDLNGDEQD